VVSFVQGEGANSVLQGFTIQNGASGSRTLSEGGGITVENSSPTILSNRIVNNFACYNGGGIGVRAAGGTRILNNTIIGNTTTSDGGGVVLWAGGAVTLRDNVISGNTAGGAGGGIATVNFAPATIVDNLISGTKHQEPEGSLSRTRLHPSSTTQLQATSLAALHRQPSPESRPASTRSCELWGISLSRRRARLPSLAAPTAPARLREPSLTTMPSHPVEVLTPAA
jgi:hypothetical protein